MKPENKAILELFVKELLDVLGEPYLRVNQLEREVRALIDLWVKANDLHPENIMTTSNNASSEETWIEVTYTPRV